LSEHPTHRFRIGKEGRVWAVVSTDLDFVRLVERTGRPSKRIPIEGCDFPSKVIEQLLRRRRFGFMIS